MGDVVSELETAWSDDPTSRYCGGTTIDNHTVREERMCFAPAAGKVVQYIRAYQEDSAP